MLLVLKSAWMIQPTSQSRKLFSLTSHAPTKRASTVLLPFPLLQVFSQRTSICTVVRSMTGAVAVTHRTHHSAMASASGSLLVAAQFPSMWVSRATSNCATASSPPMHPSATALTSNCSDGPPATTEVSGAWLVSHPSGCASLTGCSLSTSEHRHLTFTLVQITNTIGRRRVDNAITTMLKKDPLSPSQVY